MFEKCIIFSCICLIVYSSVQHPPHTPILPNRTIGNSAKSTNSDGCQHNLDH